MLGTLAGKINPPYLGGERGKSNLVARALYDNEADAPDELTFAKGDLLTVLEQNTNGLSGWWLCALRGRQGIAPGNRLRLLPGTYDPTGLGCGPSASEGSLPTGVEPESGDRARRRSWHVNPVKVVMPQKVGDVYVYDVPASTRACDEVDSAGHRRIHHPLGSAVSLDSSYDTPTSTRIVRPHQTYDEPRPHSLPSTDTAYDVPRSHLPCHDYDVPAEDLEYDFPAKTTYDVPPSLHQRPTTRADNNVVPPSQLLRNPPINNASSSNRSSGVSVLSATSSSGGSLSGSQTSLNASLSLSSLCGSNRSSLEQPTHELYDIPPSETRKVCDGSPAKLDLYDVPQNNSSPSQVYDTPPPPRSVNRPPVAPNMMEGVYDVPPQVTRDVAPSVARPDSPDGKRLSISSVDSKDLALVSGKELPIDLDGAMEILVNLQQEVQGSISKLFGFFAGSSWRKKEDDAMYGVKIACHKMRTALADFVTFSQSALANSTHAADKSLSQKLSKLVRPLVDADAIIQRTTRSLDDRGWRVAPEDGGGSTPDELDQLVACARSLVEDVRHVASFIQGNSPLIFKRAQRISELQQGGRPPLAPKPRTTPPSNKTGLQDRPLPPLPTLKTSAPPSEDIIRINDYDYVSLETKEAVEKENAEIKATLPQELRKSFENLLKQSEIPVEDAKPSLLEEEKKKSGDSVLHAADAQALHFYANQTETHTMYLSNAIEAFFQAVKNNQLPKVFISHSKFVVISAHKLVYIGDTVQRNVANAEVQTCVAQEANRLCESLKTLVHNTKKAATEFPSVEAVQQMVDSVVDISHIANDLRLCVSRASQL